MKINISCPECSKEFQLENWDYNRRLKRNKPIYCSRSCATINVNKNRAKHKTLKCEGCLKEFELLASDWREKYCSKDCYFEHQKDRLQEQARKTGKDSAEKISKTKKEKLASGEQVHPWIGREHSKETIEKFKNKQVSCETKEKMSIAQVDRILSGKKSKWDQGSYFSSKMNKEFYYRSSWEKKYMIFLDNCVDVESYDFESMKMSYFYRKNKRWYIPDFIVTYGSGNKIMNEIKPIFMMKKKKNIAKFKTAREYCKQNGMEFKVLTEIELRQLGIM